MRKEEIFSKAKFIKPSEPCVAPRFRGKFYVNKKEKTEITICGLGVFRFYINGQKVSDDVFAPATSFYHEYDTCPCYVKYGEKMGSRIYCMKYDITPYIREGENVIGVVVAPGWYHLYSDECVLCYEIKSESLCAYSDDSVEWNASPVTEFVFSRGEKQDYTKQKFSTDWLMPEYSEPWKTSVFADIPETQYYIQNCPNDKIIRTLVCKKIFENSEYAVYDCGENITGTPVVKCGERGRKITVTVGEEIDEKGDLHEKWIHNQRTEYICDGSDREYYLLFTWQGFRYIRVEKGVELVRVDVIHSDIKVTADFKCDNRVLNGIFDNYIRTQLCNMHMGIPSDCPHLERRGYTGDGELVCRDAMLTLDTRDFYLKWMEDIADCQDKISGHVQYTAPYVESGGGPGGWGCAIAEVPYAFYKMFGDSEPFKKYFDNVLHYFDYLEDHSENGLVVSDQPGQWCLGDWCTPHQVHGVKPEIPEPFVNTYFYIRTLDRMLEMCELVGRGDEKEKLAAIRREKAEILVKNYFDEKTGDFADNLNSANAFALDIGLGDERTLNNLVQAVRTKPLDTGIFGTDLVPKILFAKGYFDEAVDFLSREEYPSFGYMLKNGATTLWEEWDNPRSMSHPMFGSVVKYLFFHILGIRPSEGTAGFDDIIIEPKTNKVIGNTKGYITTPKGQISVDVEDDKLKVHIPDGVKYEIRFNGKVEYI